MSQHLREIMYVGRKPSARDNITGLDRFWRWVGDIVPTSELDALKLLKHSDVWADVTDLTEAQRAQKIASVQEKLRSEKRSQQLNRTLDAATIQELQDELARRMNPSALATRQDGGAARPKIPGQSEDPTEGDGTVVERPQSSDDVVAAIIGCIMTLDPGKKELFDKDGNPYVNTVSDAIGYKVSRSEVDAALRQMAQK